MSILDDADADLRRSATPDSDDTDDDPDPRRGDPKPGTNGSLGGAYQTQIRGQTVEISGEGEVTIARPETKQPAENSGNWLNSNNTYGAPRGVEAAKQRRIVQTAAMQSIVNGIVDQLLGGELTFLDEDSAMEELSDGQEETVGRFKTLLRDVLTGPHMGDEDLDDIVTACVEDMLGPGNAYIQLLGAENADLPVASLTTLDPLTMRHNVDKNGYPKDPPYYQAPGAFAGESVSLAGNIDPVALQTDDVAVLRYPKGNRSYRVYPVSASWQVKEWLEILADSVTHHKRYYSDNEVPPGLMQIVNATDSTIQDIQAQVEQAAGDPRDFPIVGGEAPANWVEMGGTAINLDVIQEQQWFYQLCLGSLGLGKSEVGMIEDTNRANGEIEADRVYKRVAGPFGKQFEQAFLHVARQFDVFTDLGQPFTPTLAHTDPRAEQARRERLRDEYTSGTLTLRQYHRRLGNEGISETADMVVELNDEYVNYGDLPKWVAEAKIQAAKNNTDPDDEGAFSVGSGTGNARRSVRQTPEGVPDDAYPLSEGEDCPGTIVTGPNGGEYCKPAPDEAIDDVESLPSNYDDDPDAVANTAKELAENGASYSETVSIIEENVDGLDTNARREVRQQAYVQREATIELGGDTVSASPVIKTALTGSESELKQSALNQLNTDEYEHPRFDGVHASKRDFGAWRDEKGGSLLNDDTDELWGAAIDTTGNTNVPDDATTEPDTVGEPLPAAQGGEPVTAIGDSIQTTRETLREMFGDSVPVTRGVSGEFAEQIKEAKRNDEPVELDHRALESWSTLPDHAERFANEGDEPGVMITTEVPVDEVWGASHTTPGLTEEENEIIVAKDGSQMYTPDEIQVANDDGMIDTYDQMGT